MPTADLKEAATSDLLAELRRRGMVVAAFSAADVTGPDDDDAFDDVPAADIDVVRAEFFRDFRGELADALVQQGNNLLSEWWISRGDEYIPASPSSAP